MHTDEYHDPDVESQGKDDSTELPSEHDTDEDVEVFSEGSSLNEIAGTNIDEVFGNSEAILSPDATIDPSDIEGEGHPFTAPNEIIRDSLNEGTSSYMDRPDYNQPPEDYPDEGMSTAMEEATLAEGFPPELQDGGMSAGYPPTRDDDLPPKPSVAVAKPDPSAMSGAPLFSSLTLELPDPLTNPDLGKESLQDKEQTAAAEMVALLVPEEKLKELWVRVDSAHESINENITNFQVAQKLLDHIQSARNELMGGAENYEEAERFINEVDYKIALSKKIKEFPKFYIPGIYLYEIAWAVIFLFFLIYGIDFSNAFAGARIEGNPVVVYLQSSMVWGGFGGVIGALLALVKHFSIKQDFDRQHTWWYLNSPPIGIGMGIVVYLFMHVGLYSTLGSKGEIASPLIIYAIAWLAGYQQNVFTDLVKRMMKTLMGEEKKKSETSKNQEK